MQKIRNNRFVRGFYFLYQTYFGARRGRFAQIGKNVTITPPYNFGNPKNIFIGDNVGIGPKCFITGTHATFTIEGNCAIGEGLTVHTGDHAQIVGKFVTDITESNKPKGWDKDVRIEKDVWIGCNVTLLKGVTIKRGCIVAAGAVVAKTFPPYSVIGGVPAKFIKFRFPMEEILRHESILYPEAERLSENDLVNIFNSYESK